MFHARYVPTEADRCTGEPENADSAENDGGEQDSWHNDGNLLASVGGDQTVQKDGYGQLHEYRCKADHGLSDIDKKKGFRLRHRICIDPA